MITNGIIFHHVHIELARRMIQVSFHIPDKMRSLTLLPASTSSHDHALSPLKHCSSHAFHSLINWHKNLVNLSKNVFDIEIYTQFPS